MPAPVRLFVPDWFAVGLLVPELSRRPTFDVELTDDEETAEISIRNARPSRPDLRAIRVGSAAFALYATARYLDEHGPPGDWATHRIVAVDESLSFMPGHGWLASHAAAARVPLRATSTLCRLAAARAGLGITLLPCLLGDRDADLVRLPTGVVAATDVWIVARGRSARTRAVLALLLALWKRSSRALSGGSRSDHSQSRSNRSTGRSPRPRGGRGGSRRSAH